MRGSGKKEMKKTKIYSHRGRWRHAMTNNERYIAYSAQKPATTRAIRAARRLLPPGARHHARAKP